MHVVELGTPPWFYHAPKWSPDSKKIVLTDKRGYLWLVDVDHPAPVKIDADRYVSFGANLDPSWSHDSHWLMYIKQLPNHYHAVFVYSLDTKQIHQLTDGRSDATSPRFDRGGKYVWFQASTDVGPTLGGLDMSTEGRPVAASIYAIALDKTTPSPAAPESDEEGAGSGSGSGGAKPGALEPKPPGLRIDFEDIDQRVVALPIDRAKYL